MIGYAHHSHRNVRFLLAADALGIRRRQRAMLECIEGPTQVSPEPLFPTTLEEVIICSVMT